jgi:peroxiredoxin
MTNRFGALLLFGGLLAATAFAFVGEKSRVGQTVADFTLKDPRDDQEVRLSGLKDKKAIVVVFLGTECPVNNAFLPVLTGLHKEFADKGVVFLGINANQQDTPARVAEHARKAELPFPVLKDVGNRVADQFGAQRTPEAFVLAPGGKVLYHGRIDDQFGLGYQRPGKPTRRDLALALEEILADKPVAVATTPVAGCLIGRVVEPKADGKVTFTKHVAPLLQKHCQECHRPGRIGPMALLTYDDAVAWSAMMREVLEDKRMPPWFADSKHGKWSNDRSLPDEDRATLVRWIDAGMPKGDPKDLPAPAKFPEGWTIGKPDQIFTMPKAFDVPADMPKGGVPYKHFMVETDFKEDKWVIRAEAKPGTPSVVHHMLIFILPPGERFNPDKPGAVLCGMAPGDMPLLLEDGLAKKVPAGSRLIFQMHYTPNGKAATDQSSIGVVFAKEQPKFRVLTRPVVNPKFFFRIISIPAGDDNFQIESEFTFKDGDGHLIGFMPHMHLRGKDFLAEAIYPDGKKETLLSVPRYNFNWQSVYRCAKPLPMPKGTKIRYVAHFDNSTKNPHNPDPTQTVFWGDQTWEEMMVGWMDYYYDGELKK